MNHPARYPRGWKKQRGVLKSCDLLQPNHTSKVYTMSFDDYTVTVHFINFLNQADINTFNVMAYSEEEAQELAFSNFSEIHGDNYQTVESFEVELDEEVDW